MFPVQQQANSSFTDQRSQAHPWSSSDHQPRPHNPLYPFLNVSGIQAAALPVLERFSSVAGMGGPSSHEQAAAAAEFRPESSLLLDQQRLVALLGSSNLPTTAVRGQGQEKPTSPDPNAADPET
jgi:hypothetical protein